jgi:hypothetical protein
VRWDRLGRLAMLGVLVILVYLYVSPARALWSAWHEAGRRKTDVARLKRANAQLRARRDALLVPSTLDLQARTFGLVRRGERLYNVDGLPSN